MAKGPAPVNLDLRTIAFPVMAVVSILHRISGILLFLAIPLSIYAMHLSLKSAQDFERLGAFLHSLPVRLLAVVLVWSLLHHLFAGIRFLLLDLAIGLSRTQARMTAWLVLAGSLLLLFTFVWAI